MFLQRTAGNAAVSKLLKSGSRRVQRQPAPSPTAPTQPPPVPDNRPGPEIRQGELGEVVLPLPNIHVVDAQQTKKEWKKGIGGGALIKIPVPQLPGATVGLVGFGEIGATFTADYGPGKFENLRVGMSKWQAAQILAGVSPLLTWNTARVLYQGPFTAIGDFSLPASVGLRMFARAGMGLRGDVVGVKLLQIAASLEAELNARLALEKPLQDRISIYYANGDLRFRAAFEKNLQFNLGIALNAAITAEILKLWRWERRWRLAESVAKTIDMTKWPSLLRINVKNESHGTLPMKTDGPALNALIVPSETKVTVGIEEGDLNVDALLERVFEESDKRGNENEVKQKDGAGGGGPGGGGGSGGGGPNGHVAPTGTRQSPIPITWYKPPRWYLDPVRLMINGRQEEFRRNRKAMLPHGEAIGVSYWPAVGDLIFLTTPTKRSGTMQTAFNSALTRYGFKLAGWNADHVEDIEMGGSDDFDNLWPLEAGVNSRAGNWQLGQPVTFSRDDEPVGNVNGPIAIQGQDYLRGRWLRIRDFQDPPGGNP